MTVLGAQRIAASAAWRNFHRGAWCDDVNVRDFIQQNYAPYEGDASFLAGPTERTVAVWSKVSRLFPEERRRGSTTWTCRRRPRSPRTRPATSIAISS
ncbi:hypothetical protein [Actinomadura madurae]|uniref:hypothetical protein n=1 Tax=Actinomadura madurae TaxID=1993 RepID=UPI0020D223B6|nr:hypothetical protein [Actinomadura madurae]MCP9948951.1 hypothetical protein [Actinomadura madurae]MCP9965723.1 hypothetical protein [Actinomadura madurae]MCP9978197.1 hypothetical protein [Actinomadura madurae]MCQ0014403.1 hypothetical protein [Actinomadura madurae]